MKYLTFFKLSLFISPCSWAWLNQVINQSWLLLKGPIMVKRTTKLSTGNLAKMAISYFSTHGYYQISCHSNRFKRCWMALWKENLFSFHCKRSHINFFNGDGEIAQNTGPVWTLKVHQTVIATVYAKLRIGPVKIKVAVRWKGRILRRG